MAPHSSTLAWKIPWTEEPGRLQSMGSLRVGHDWETSLSLFIFMHWRRKWQPAPVFFTGESQGRGSLVGCCLWGRRVGHNWSDLAAVAHINIHIKHIKFPYTHTYFYLSTHIHTIHTSLPTHIPAYIYLYLSIYLSVEAYLLWGIGSRDFRGWKVSQSAIVKLEIQESQRSNSVCVWRPES